MPSRWRSAASFSPTAAWTPRPAGAVPKRHRAISEGTAAIVTRILEQNVQSGTGTRAAFGRPAAGKTGTNEEHADAWFAGYTPDLATTVWMGYTSGEIPMRERARDRGQRRKLPGRDLAPLHGACARGHSEPEAFPEPAVWPEWKPFTRGEYALTYDPTATTETTDTETDDDTARGRRRRRATTPPSGR